MKISEITTENVADYLRLEEGFYTKEELIPIMTASKNFMISYTGLSEEKLDDHEDFYIVYMALCQDMYDNRSIYSEKTCPNKIVQSILGMYCVNLLQVVVL